ncbi:hypothetical protein NPIL_34891 [Nephila pilipes]|uniref:Uncharacterized protein n=1 Tax=Nephila pilipes TaxID=299642 RepID=A0A8X6P9Q3_NEPPI|nr:hypothetical protein NPIL_34891 [Nephila pilipes]
MIAPTEQISKCRLELLGALLLARLFAAVFKWSHVSSKDDPADLASRSMNPEECKFYIMVVWTILLVDEQKSLATAESN